MKYGILMAQNPTLLHTMVNQLGQEIEYYEHPTYGDTYPVIAVLHSAEQAKLTDFYDTEDFFEDSDYNYVYLNGLFDCAFNFYKCGTTTINESLPTKL